MFNPYLLKHHLIFQNVGKTHLICMAATALLGINLPKYYENNICCNIKVFMRNYVLCLWRTNRSCKHIQVFTLIIIWPNCYEELFLTILLIDLQKKKS